MGNKKKYRIGFYILLLTLSLLLLNAFSICYADEPNYNDYELPIEFFDSLITYINNHLSYNQYLSNFTLNSYNMKTVYDSSIKAFIKEKIDSLGGNERNMLIYISPPANSNGQLLIYFLVQNNTIANTGNQYKVDIYSNYFQLLTDDIPDNTTRCIRVYPDGTCNFWTRASIDYSILYWTYDVNNFDFNNTSYNNGPFFGVNKKPLNQVHLKHNGSFNYYFINGFYPINDLSEPEEPEEPSGDIISTGTGTITNNSGDTTGKIDLSGIEQGIGNIQNQISGDTQKVIENQNQNTEAITSSIDVLNENLTNDADDLIDNTIITNEDIANTVDFSIINNNQNYNAYTNFWYNLTTGFSNSMTNIVRTLPIEFRNKNYLINLDDFTVFIPDVLKVFLGIISSVFVCLYITRESKHIVEDIQTASIDNVANKLTEDFESNMF